MKGISMKPKIGQAWQGDWTFPRVDPTPWIPFDEPEERSVDWVVFVVAVVLGIIGLFFVH